MLDQVDRDRTSPKSNLGRPYILTWTRFMPASEGIVVGDGRSTKSTRCSPEHTAEGFLCDRCLTVGNETRP